MKNITSIKQAITKLNNQCDLNHISILMWLQQHNMSIYDFCALIGIDPFLLNEIALSELQFLINDKNTRIYFNREMQSLAEDEISIYSPEYHTTFSYLTNNIKIIYDESVNNNIYKKLANEFMGTKKENDKLITIHFSSECLIDYAKSKILSKNYPLEHVTLDIRYIVNSLDNEVLDEQNFQITINHEMLYSDLVNIFRILYKYNYSLAVAILKIYPSSMKIMSDEVSMNNFHNR